MLGAAQKVVNLAGSNNIVVASTGTAYSVAMAVNNANYFGVWAKATSATGTADVKVEIEQSYVLPATECAADANWAVPDGKDPIFAQLNDEAAHIGTVTPVPMTFMRYKFTGLGDNPADTIINLYQFLQEQSRS
jgi:hypothetical protein